MSKGKGCYMSNIGERIYNIRKCINNLTQEQLITKMNKKFNMKVSRNMLSNWERGKQMPNIESVNAISEILGVSTDYIIKGIENKSLQKEKPCVYDGLEIKSADDIYKKGVYDGIDNEEADFYYQMPINNMSNANIFSGDYVLFKIQKALNDGDIGLFLIDGQLYVKRYYSQKNRIVLVDECIGGRPMIRESEKDFEIIGRAVSVKRLL